MTDTAATPDPEAKPPPVRHVVVDVFHHFDEPVTIRHDVSGSVTVVVQQPVPPAVVATHAILNVTSNQGANPMPGQINVDTTNETATVQFVDDHGDVAPAPDGVTVAVISSDPSLTVGTPDPSDPLTFPLVPVTEGASSVSATFTNADGSPALEPNGNPFAVDAVTVTIAPGPAAGASLVLSV